MAELCLKQMMMYLMNKCKVPKRITVLIDDYIVHFSSLLDKWPYKK